LCEATATVTGAPLKIAAKNVQKFTAGKALKDALK
jgi:nucleoid DNA-binding protein